MTAAARSDAPSGAESQRSHEAGQQYPPPTRFLFRADLPSGTDVMVAVVNATGETILAIRPGLTREARRRAVRKALERVRMARQAELNPGRSGEHGGPAAQTGGAQ